MACNERSAESLVEVVADTQISMDGGGDTRDIRKSLSSSSISNKKIMNVKKIANKPVSPDPLTKGYDQTDECDLPFCPKHGVRSRVRKSLDSADIESFEKSVRVMVKSNTITLDQKKEKTQINRSLSETALSVTDINVECIKDMQKRRMRNLNRASSNKKQQDSIEKKDKVNKELVRRFSDLPAVLDSVLNLNNVE